MHIGSQFVGTPLKTYQSQITWRDTMNYAAAINDGNPLYFLMSSTRKAIRPSVMGMRCWLTVMIWPRVEIQVAVPFKNVAGGRPTVTRF